MKPFSVLTLKLNEYEQSVLIFLWLRDYDFVHCSNIRMYKPSVKNIKGSIVH